tara:strand:+ start:1709 stop:2287 length:579 start_codon:yes stop_codon:yes gene_type:complete
MGVLLVSSDKIKAFTNINDNIDESILLSNIQIAQDIGLQTLLGTQFYNEIKTKAQANTLNGPETTLLQDYIQPYLIQRAYYESIPNIWMRVMNKSITIGNTEQGQAVSAGDMKYLRTMTQNRYEFYAQRMMDFLKDHQNDYPTYFSYSSNQGMAPTKENYFNGIHIPPGQRRLPPPGIKGYLDPSSDLLCCR